MFICDPFSIRCLSMDLLGELEGGGWTGWAFVSPCWGWAQLPHRLSHRGCAVLSFFPHLLGDLTHFLLVSICCKLSGAENIFFCVHQLLSPRPLLTGVNMHRNAVKIMIFITAALCPTGRAALGGEDRKGSRGSQDPRWVPILSITTGFVCFRLCRRRGAGVQLDVFIPGLRWILQTGNCVTAPSRALTEP